MGHPKKSNKEKLLDYVKTNSHGEFEANKEIGGRTSYKIHKSKKTYNRKNKEKGEENGEI